METKYTLETTIAENDLQTLGKVIGAEELQTKIARQYVDIQPDFVMFSGSSIHLTYSVSRRIKDSVQSHTILNMRSYWGSEDEQLFNSMVSGLKNLDDAAPTYMYSAHCMDEYLNENLDKLDSHVKYAQYCSTKFAQYQLPTIVLGLFDARKGEPRKMLTDYLKEMAFYDGQLVHPTGKPKHVSIAHRADPSMTDLEIFQSLLK